MHSAGALQRYSASCYYKIHGYLDIEKENLVYKQNPSRPATAAPLSSIVKYAVEAFQKSPTHGNRESLRLFRASLDEKRKCLFAGCFYNTAKLDGAVDCLDEALESHSLRLGPEEVAF